MALLTVKQFAEMLNPQISRQRVNYFVKRGDLIRKDTLIDTEDPVNAEWLKFRNECPEPTPGVRTNLPPLIADDQQITEEAVTDALANLLASRDINVASYSEVQKIQRLEQTLKTRVERQQKRGELIDRALIRTVFGRIYQVETQEMKMLGARLAPEVSGILGIDDPTLVLMVEKRIEGEVLKSLTHIKRIIDNFLKEVRAGAI